MENNNVDGAAALSEGSDFYEYEDKTVLNSPRSPRSPSPGQKGHSLFNISQVSNTGLALSSTVDFNS